MRARMDTALARGPPACSVCVSFDPTRATSTASGSSRSATYVAETAAMTPAATNAAPSGSEPVSTFAARGPSM